MKTKSSFLAVAAICTLLVSLAPAQPGVPNPAIPALDPTTGLPVAQAIAEPQWIDTDWPDPGIVLTNVTYNGFPLSEVARQLRSSFKDTIDILPMPQTFGTNWGDTTIQLQLHDVRANDVFNAMNMIFENDRTPLRWQLTENMNKRPLVMLRVLPEAQPASALQTSPPEKHRMVYFVGDLIGDEKSGGMTMEQIVKTIADFSSSGSSKPDGDIQFHTDAQLLVVSGTPEQLEFVHQILEALHQKVEASRPKSADVKDIEEMNQVIKSLKALGNSQ